MPEPMPDRALLAEIVRRIDPAATLVDARPLEGGVSAQIIALDIARASGRQERLVLRRHGAWDLQQNPRIAAMEYALLRCLADRGLPVPAPVHLDESGALLPTPWLVQTYLPGEPRWGAALTAASGADPELLVTVDAIAAQMAAIHAVAADDPSLPALTERLEACLNDLAQPPATLDESLSEGAIRAALLAAHPPQRNPRVLLHNDLWPGNILWQDNAISGILDWSEAGLGDPLADLGNSRLELLWAYGEAAMERFTATYLDLTGHDATALPWWDLIAALKPCGRLHTWGIHSEREASMRVQHRWFTARAIDQLAEFSHR